jgi:anti-sigma factor RsiW
MECDELEAQLTDFLEGSLPAEVEAAAIEHVATCARCEAVLTGTQAVIAAAPEGRVELPESERAELLQRILSVVDDSGERHR